MDSKERSPFPHTMVTGLVNFEDYYFPTEESFTEGPEGFTPMIMGYETTPGTTIHEIGAGEKLVESSVRQLNKLFISAL